MTIWLNLLDLNTMTSGIKTTSQFEEKIYAGWLGKAIGGTLGGPYEGRCNTRLRLSFYDPVPDRVMPNDDLDLQVVWLTQLAEENATSVRPQHFPAAWQRYVGFPWCEYGVGLRNIHYGLQGADLGAFDNWFAECMGAAIRSEVWAFLAAGDIERVKSYAWADAVFDHAGDGVWAEIFFAVMEARAFDEPDIGKLIEAGLAAIPSQSRITFAVRRTQFLWENLGDWEAVWERLVADIACTHFTDAPLNIAFTILGLLAGEGDFGRSILIANNCGWDTDCTAATVASIMAIADPSCIPSEWRNPIGNEVLLNKQIREIPPTTLEALTESTLKLRHDLRNDVPHKWEVPLHRRPTIPSPIHVSYAFGTLDKPVPELTTSCGHLLAQTACGHWFRQCVNNMQAKTAHFRFDVDIEGERPVRFMAFLARPCRTFVDGEPYANFDSSTWAAGWSGPSFHIFQEHGHAPGVSLSPGRHSFDVLLEHDGSDSIEIVVGVGDAETDQWLPFALAKRQ